MLQANYTEMYDRLIFLYSSIPNTFLISLYALFLMLMERSYLYQTSAVPRISALWRLRKNLMLFFWPGSQALPTCLSRKSSSIKCYNYGTLVEWQWYDKLEVLWQKCFPEPLFFSTINLILICSGSSPKLHGERMAASFLNHGTVLSMTKS
jgi:hypothetical protein